MKYVRQATLGDLSEISAIFEDAKKVLSNDGSSQWQNGSPSIENFKKSQNLLGFSDDSKKILENAIKNKSGMIIFSGPTGSGKSTSLYSLLNKLNDENRNIISIENPVEINILGINQISINEKIGLTFQNALRSILRQDPDIIMLGEIRDKETAKMAVRAAITGHLVLTTLHTNNSFASINRLRDLGVEDYLIKQSVNTLASQRLVRKLCSCKKKRKISKEEYNFVKNYFRCFSIILLTRIF